MKQEWCKIVPRPLQNKQENWVSMVSIRNLEIKMYGETEKKEDAPYAMKKRMKYIYFLNTYIFGIEWHTNGRKNSGMKNGLKKTEEEHIRR